MWPCIPSLLLATVFAVQGAHGFPFTHTDPTECGDMTVTWEGGSPPFRLLIVPDGQTLRNISIPDNSFDGTTGSFTTPMPWVAGTRLILSMSDATDLTAGGISNILTLGPANGATCDTTVIQADFFFSLEGNLEQCGQFPFSGYELANRPVSVFGFVPNGRHFSVEGVQDTSFSWRVTEPAGTSVFFFMTDANQRNGGVALREVGPSGDSSCLSPVRPSSSSPSPTSGTGRPSGSGTSRRPAPSDGADDGSSTGDEKEEKKGSNIGLIVGAAAGGFVALGLFAFIAVFCFKRKRKQNNPTGEVKIDIDAPTAPFKSPSNTYLLPSSYNGSNSNLAPNQAAAPYAQHSYQSSISYGAPMGGSSLQTRPSYQAATPTASMHPAEYNPYAANEMGALGHSSQQSTSNASGVSPYGGMSSGQSTATTSYPPSSGYGMAAAAGAGAYGAYNQYQQQHQAPNHQQYPPSSQQGYNVGTPGPLYATNADAPSTPYTAMAVGSSKPTHKASGSTEKRAPPVQASQQRVIQHQDIDESDLPEELPPQYSERRAPIPGLPSSYAAGSHNPDRKS